MATGTGTGWTWGTWAEDQGEEEDEETEYQPSGVSRATRSHFEGASIRIESAGSSKVAFSLYRMQT